MSHCCSNGSTEKNGGSLQSTEKSSQKFQQKNSYAPGAAIGFAAFGILLMIIGVCCGDLPVILQKAANICLECIGIG